MSSEIVPIESIEFVYRRRSASLFRLALARTYEPEAARDAVQDGFARAIRARTGFRSPASLEQWICRCVLHATDDSPPPAKEDELRTAVHRLPSLQRDALFLRVYLDYDYLKIAETLGIEVETVPAMLRAARRNLSQALEEVAR